MLRSCSNRILASLALVSTGLMAADTKVLPNLEPGKPAAASTAAGATLTPAPQPTTPWEYTAAGGMAFSRGNINSLTYSLQFLATYVTPETDAYIGADYFYGEAANVKNTNLFRVFGDYKHMINDRWYWGLGAEYLTDSIANIDYRFSLAPKLGLVAFKTDRSKLTFDFGPAYIWQQQGIRDEYAALWFGQRYENQISERVKFWQSLSYMPEAGDFGNYLLVGEIGVQALLTNHLALKVFFRDMYDSTPAAGRQANDMALISSITWAPGGFAPEPPAARRTLKPSIALPAAPALGWTSSAAVGFTMAKGNADNLALTVNYDTAWRSATDEFLFGLIGIYGQANGTTNTQSLLLNSAYNHLLNERWYAGASLGFMHNEPADLAYRFTPGLNLGVYFIRNDRVKLSVEAGPAGVFENQGGQSRSYFAFQAGEKLSWKINDTFTIGQSLYYNAAVSDWSDSYLIATAFLDTALGDNLSFRLGITNNYDNQPAAGFKKNDFILSSGIAVKF
ncbi:MAG: DUF481 domain-containing protein [Verrucomicrobiaceae bacterium]|nr:DUF481 domain-containing protein [Verrucomicrobiaceae bacterium]